MRRSAIFLLILLVSLASCERKPFPTHSNEKPSILVTAAPYAYFLEKIGKGHLQPQILVPPGANPHIYEPSPKQVEAILKTSMWFKLGESIEQKILTILKESNPDYLAIDLSKNIPSIYMTEDCHETCAHNHDTIDRHFWLSPKIAALQVAMMTKALIESYPRWESDFKLGCEELLQELSELDHQLQKELLPFAGEAILVSHPAFGYFCEEFHLKQLSIESEGKDPLPQDIVKTLKEAQSFHVRAIFLQAQYSNKGTILIAEKLNLPIYEVDPYALNYTENLIRIGELISQPSLHTSLKE